MFYLGAGPVSCPTIRRALTHHEVFWAKNTIACPLRHIALTNTQGPILAPPSITNPVPVTITRIEPRTPTGQDHVRSDHDSRNTAASLVIPKPRRRECHFPPYITWRTEGERLANAMADIASEMTTHSRQLLQSQSRLRGRLAPRGLSEVAAVTYTRQTPYTRAALAIAQNTLSSLSSPKAMTLLGARDHSIWLDVAPPR